MSSRDQGGSERRLRLVAILVPLALVMFVAVAVGAMIGYHNFQHRPKPVTLPRVSQWTVSTDNVAVVYCRGHVGCWANDSYLPSHSVILVANYGDEGGYCDVHVEALGTADGGSAGDPAWVSCPANVFVPAAKAVGLPLRFEFPRSLAGGPYWLQVVVESGGQRHGCPVVIYTENPGLVIPRVGGGVRAA